MGNQEHMYSCTINSNDFHAWQFCRIGIIKFHWGESWQDNPDSQADILKMSNEGLPIWKGFYSLSSKKANLWESLHLTFIMWIRVEYSRKRYDLTNLRGLCWDHNMGLVNGLAKGDFSSRDYWKKILNCLRVYKSRTLQNEIEMDLLILLQVKLINI